MRNIVTKHGEFSCKYNEDDECWEFYKKPQYEEEIQGKFVCETFLPKEDATDEELATALGWELFETQYEYKKHDSLISVEMLETDKGQITYHGAYICESLELAIKIAKKMQYRFCIENKIEMTPHEINKYEVGFEEITEESDGVVAQNEFDCVFRVRISRLDIACYKGYHG